MELRLSRSINQATKRDALIPQGFRTKESPPQHLSLSLPTSVLLHLVLVNSGGTSYQSHGLEL